jgi:hypothetical protein
VSALTAGSVRTIAFGDLDAGVWGFAWGDGEQVAAAGAARAGDPLVAETAGIAGADAGQEWVLTGAALELRIAPVGGPVSHQAPAGFHELCRVRGRATVDGRELEVDVPGLRGVHSESSSDIGALDSVREVSAWFAPGDGLALTALRPRGAKGHDRDLVVASVLDPAGAIGVADPRLSTTYTAAGRPARVGLELWIPQEDSEEQYPRRAAGESLGAAAAGSLGSVTLEAELLRCRSHGEEGIGVYLLARPR